MFVKIKRIAAIILAVLMLASILTGCKKSDVPDGYQLIACEGDEFRLYVPTQGWMYLGLSGLGISQYLVR